MKESPDISKWLEEVKSEIDARNCGMFLIHNGTVRETARELVRDGKDGTSPVTAMDFSYDGDRVAVAVERTLEMPGIFFARVWLNEGRLSVGDDIMYVLIGGDIRPHVIDALQFLVGTIKTNCVTEKENY